MRVPLFRWRHRLHRWTSHACCCVGTVQLVEIVMRPRIGVLDLRVAVVLDARPHRWRARRRWCQGICPSADARTKIERFSDVSD
jgi:hypothetical protein